MTDERDSRHPEVDPALLPPRIYGPVDPPIVVVTPEETELRRRKVKDFLICLGALSEHFGMYLSACGCCGGINLDAISDGTFFDWFADHITWHDGEYTASVNV